MFDDILERENTFVGNKNNNKVKKLVFFQTDLSMGLVKNWQIFRIFISAKK